MVIAESDFMLEEISGDTAYPMAAFTVSGDAAVTAPAVRLQPGELPEPDLANARRIRLDMTGGAMGGMVDIVYQGRKLEGRDVMTVRQAWAFNAVANLAEEPFFAASRGETILVESVNRTA